MKLSPVFPPEILPVREGVYLTTQVDPDTGIALEQTKCYSYFDTTDRIWGCGYPQAEDAFKQPSYEFAHQVKSWQGLAEEPKP